MNLNVAWTPLLQQWTRIQGWGQSFGLDDIRGHAMLEHRVEEAVVCGLAAQKGACWNEELSKYYCFM